MVDGTVQGLGARPRKKGGYAARTAAALRIGLGRALRPWAVLAAEPAHALIVPPNAIGYEIIAGHHRKLAAEAARLAKVPCWVPKVSDVEGYMTLVLCNAQSELTALERGFHSLRLPLGGKA